MKETIPPPHFEFWFQNLDTHIRVEEKDDGVIIRASRNTFSERRKAMFIRELADEGFVSDHYRLFSGYGPSLWLPVRWLVDSSWLQPTKAQMARANRLRLRAFIYAVVLWVSVMIWILPSIFYPNSNAKPASHGGRWGHSK